MPSFTYKYQHLPSTLKNSLGTYFRLRPYPLHMSSPPAKEQSHQLNRELRDVISILTGLGKASGTSFDDSAGIITLAGTNKGAMMKMNGPDAVAITDHISAAAHRGGSEGTEAFANSNCQSINNSIVIGGSCGAEDPGIHLIIQDYVAGDGREEGDVVHGDGDEEKIKKKDKVEDGKKGAKTKDEATDDAESDE